MSLLLVLFSVSAWASGSKILPASCPVLLQAAEEWVFADEEEWAFAEEEACIKKAPLLKGLTLPASIAESQAQFEADRIIAETLIQPTLAALRKSLILLGPKVHFELLLNSLAAEWDKCQGATEKAELMNAMDKLFTIRLEDVYLELIAQGPYSLPLKEALYQKLARRFKSAPAWRPYLDFALEQADPVRAEAKRQRIAQNPSAWGPAPPRCAGH